MSNTVKNASRKDYRPHERINIKDIELGCLQRIADATETIATDHQRLKNHISYLEAQNERLRKQNTLLKRRLAAAKGFITRLKKQLAALRKEPT